MSKGKQLLNDFERSVRVLDYELEYGSDMEQETIAKEEVEHRRNNLSKYIAEIEEKAWRYDELNK